MHLRCLIVMHILAPHFPLVKYFCSPPKEFFLFPYPPAKAPQLCVIARGGLWGPHKGEWPLWGEEKPRYRWNFLLTENETLYLVLRRCGNPPPLRSDHRSSSVGADSISARKTCRTAPCGDRAHLECAPTNAPPPMRHCEERSLGPPQRRMAFVGRGEAKIQVEFSACRK